MLQVKKKKGAYINARVEFAPDKLSYTKEKINYITYIQPLEINQIYGARFIDAPQTDSLKTEKK
jgi:hypothetical protein